MRTRDKSRETISQYHSRAGFTLLELAAVIVILSILIAMLIPAIGPGRAAARRSNCDNNLRQLGLALNQYEHQRGYFPSSRAGAGGYSAQVQLLPYLGELGLYEHIEFAAPYDQYVSAGGDRWGMQMPQVLHCPDQITSQTRDDAAGQPLERATAYVVNCGVWFVWDPASGAGGAGAFYPYSRLKRRDFRDGLSSTIAFAEVITFSPCVSTVGRPGWLPMPTAPDRLPLAKGQAQAQPEAVSHASWTLGQAHQTGFTGTFSPGASTSQWTNQPEGTSPTIRTYAALTPSSPHSNTIGICLVEGSVTRISDSIDARVLSSLCTRSGGELNSAVDSW
jgi:prepilin-type N-terminal cleavage/methylation domain-containing protein